MLPNINEPTIDPMNNNNEEQILNKYMHENEVLR